VPQTGPNHVSPTETLNSSVKVGSGAIFLISVEKSADQLQKEAKYIDCPNPLCLGFDRVPGTIEAIMVTREICQEIRKNTPTYLREKLVEVEDEMNIGEIRPSYRNDGLKAPNWKKTLLNYLLKKGVNSSRTLMTHGTRFPTLAEISRTLANLSESANESARSIEVAI
jgi:hypothetical protein